MSGPRTVQEAVARTIGLAKLFLAGLPGLPTQARDARCRDSATLRLVKIAVQKYRLTYPECPARGPWLFYDGDPSPHSMTGRWKNKTPERVDVYCLFCRELLVNPAVWDFDYSYQLQPHTTMCAMRFLAGEISAGAPHTYRLPSEVP